MTFNSLTFFVFATVVFAAYWAVRSRRTQNMLLLVVSYVFYGWWDWRFCGLIAASSAVDFGVGLWLSRTQDEQPGPRRQRHRRTALALSIATNLGLLGVFKYYNFFADNLVLGAASLGVSLSPSTLQLVLPVGISFYTFQTLGTTIDVYRGRLGACRSLVDYFAYVSFFPQLVAGPIERGARLLPQFQRDRRFDAGLAADGLCQALWGFVQKAALADNLATLVNDYYIPTSPGPVLAVCTVAFAFQIYWDFAGYSNIAIGTARLFGFSLSRNFALPYFSRSVAEFWRRWHISLSTWFRDYVYVPLGGNKRGRARQAINILLTFVISGLWHGAAWHFVAWGAINGLAAMPTIVSGRSRAQPVDTPGGEGSSPGLRGALQMLATFSIVCVGWVFFRATSVEAALQILTRIVTECGDIAAWSSLAAHEQYLRAIMPLAVLGVMAEWLQRRHPHVLVLDAWPRWSRWALYTMLFWGAMYVLPETPPEFIYFQF